MSGGLLFISRILVFLVVFVLVTNIARVILGARIGIVPYQVHIASALVFTFLAILSGRFFRLSKANLVVLGWLASLSFVMIVSVLFVSNDYLALEVFKGIGRFIMMAVTFTVLMQNRELLPASGYGALAAVVVSMVVSYMEFTNPEFRIVRDVMFETDADRVGAQRIAGLHVDPNENGSLMVLGLFVTQYFLPKSLRFIFALLIGFAVFTTASRGSLILWLIVISVCFWLGVYSKGKVIPKITALSIAAIFTLLVSTGQVPVIVNALNLEEYMNQNMIDRLSSGFLTQEDGSTQARLIAIQENLENFGNHPIIGSGLGDSISDKFTIGSHNMLLRMASELGLVGVMVYLSLLVVPIIAKSKEGFFFVVFFYISNLFNHTAFERSTFAILVPLAIIYFAAQPEKSRSKKRRRHRKRTENPGFYG